MQSLAHVAQRPHFTFRLSRSSVHVPRPSLFVSLTPNVGASVGRNDAGMSGKILEVGHKKDLEIEWTLELDNPTVTH